MVDKNTAKILAYTFLALGLASLAAAFYYHGSDYKFSAVPTSSSTSKNLIYLSALFLAGAAASGMAWRQVKSAQILNFVSAILACGLIAYGGYNSWDFAPLSIAAGIAAMTCLEFLVEG